MVGTGRGARSRRECAAAAGWAGAPLATPAPGALLAGGPPSLTLETHPSVEINYFYMLIR